MKPRANGMSKPQRETNYQPQGPNWILIAGGALLSTLSIRLACKLKQVLDTKKTESTASFSKGSGKLVDRQRSGNCQMHSNLYCFTDDDDCLNCVKVTEPISECNHQNNSSQSISEPDMAALPLVRVPTPRYSRESKIWASSPDRLELHQKPFHRSNSSDSPCVSESGSDIFTKREVIQKLRQQLKRRDEMVLEMQDQITELRSSLTAQLSHSTHLQSLLDAANRDLFDSEREIQRLRKAIADHCLGQVGHVENTSVGPVWPPEGRNGHLNGGLDVGINLGSLEKGRGEEERIKMLKKEVAGLKEAMESKEYLLKSYKEQKLELSSKVKELQQRLDSQLPSILVLCCDVFCAYTSSKAPRKANGSTASFVFKCRYGCVFVVAIMLPFWLVVENGPSWRIIIQDLSSHFPPVIFTVSISLP